MPHFFAPLYFLPVGLFESQGTKEHQTVEVRYVRDKMCAAFVQIRFKLPAIGYGKSVHFRSLLRSHVGGTDSTPRERGQQIVFVGKEGFLHCYRNSAFQVPYLLPALKDPLFAHNRKVQDV